MILFLFDTQIMDVLVKVTCQCKGDATNPETFFTTLNVERRIKLGQLTDHVVRLWAIAHDWHIEGGIEVYKVDLVSLEARNRVCAREDDFVAEIIAPNQGIQFFIGPKHSRERE